MTKDADYDPTREIIVDSSDDGYSTEELDSGEEDDELRAVLRDAGFGRMGLRSNRGAAPDVDAPRARRAAAQPEERVASAAQAEPRSARAGPRLATRGLFAGRPAVNPRGNAAGTAAGASDAASGSGLSAEDREALRLRGGQGEGYSTSPTPEPLLKSHRRRTVNSGEQVFPTGPEPRLVAPSECYPFPAEPVFVSDRATEKLADLLDGDSFVETIFLDRQMRPTAPRLAPKVSAPPYNSATLIVLAYTKAEVQTSAFAALDFSDIASELYLAGTTVIRTSDRWCVLAIIQQALSLALRDRTMAKRVEQVVAERLQYDAMSVGCDRPSANDGRHREANEKLRRDQGVDHLVLWEPLAHDPRHLNVSKDTFRSASAFGAFATLGYPLAPLHELATKLAWVLDPVWYEETVKQYKLKIADSAFDRIMNVSKFYIWQGTAIVHNLRPLSHRDSTDDPLGLAAMAPTGMYDGGSLRLRQLNLRLRYRPHSVCLLRSALLHHEVLNWANGFRNSVVNFWRRSFRDLGPFDVDWNALRYGYAPEFSSGRPPIKREYSDLEGRQLKAEEEWWQEAFEPKPVRKTSKRRKVSK